MRSGARALARGPPGRRTPWCSILVRKCYGIAGAGARRRLAAEPALRLAERQLGLAADRGRPGGRATAASSRPPRRSRARPPARRCAREIEARLRAVTSPFRTAERFSIEHIIDPRDTRRLLCEWAAAGPPDRRPGRRRRRPDPAPRAAPVGGRCAGLPGCRPCPPPSPPTPSSRSRTDETAQALADDSAVVVDVREGYEREAGHIAGTSHIELERPRRAVGLAAPRPHGDLLLPLGGAVGDGGTGLQGRGLRRPLDGGRDHRVGRRRPTALPRGRPVADH